MDKENISAFCGPSVIHNIVSFDAYFQYVLGNDESITLCIAYGVGTFDPISIEK